MTVFYRVQDSGLDDWDIANNYVQMGFRPGFAIQARELTQVQTILQSQITALAKRFLKSGSIIDATLGFSPAGVIWTGSLGLGYVYIEPKNKELGYFIYNKSEIIIPNINLSPDFDTNIYIQWEEVQVNPDGNPFPPTGGFAKVEVDGELKDNAQGYSNYSAPGASRYQINIISAGSYIVGEGSLPANAANIAYFQNGTPYYYDTGTPV